MALLRASEVLNELQNEVMKDVAAPGASESYLTLVRTFPLSKIDSKKQNGAALEVMKRLTLYLDQHVEVLPALLKTGIEQYLRCLGELIADFERAAYPDVGKATGREMLTFLMESHGLKQKDLAGELGGQSVVSDVIKGRRELNATQIGRLAERFGVSPAVFFPVK